MKDILLVVDPQIDFIEGGKLAVEGGTKALDNLINWYKGHRSELAKVYITMDSHPRDHSSFKEYGGQWPPHCIKFTKGWNVYPPLMDAIFNPVCLWKGQNPAMDEYSIFSKGNSDGESFLKNYKSFLIRFPKSKLYIAGIAGDYCVLNTVKDLIREGYGNRIVMLTECIASIDGGNTLYRYIIKNHLKTSN